MSALQNRQKRLQVKAYEAFIESMAATILADIEWASTEVASKWREKVEHWLAQKEKRRLEDFWCDVERPATKSKDMVAWAAKTAAIVRSRAERLEERQKEAAAIAAIGREAEETANKASGVAYGPMLDKTTSQHNMDWDNQVNGWGSQQNAPLDGGPNAALLTQQVLPQPAGYTALPLVGGPDAALLYQQAPPQSAELPYLPVVGEPDFAPLYQQAQAQPAGFYTPPWDVDQVVDDFISGLNEEARQLLDSVEPVAGDSVGNPVEIADEPMAGESAAQPLVIQDTTPPPPASSSGPAPVAPMAGPSSGSQRTRASLRPNRPRRHEGGVMPFADQPKGLNDMVRFAVGTKRRAWDVTEKKSPEQLAKEEKEEKEEGKRWRAEQKAAKEERRMKSAGRPKASGGPVVERAEERPAAAVAAAVPAAVPAARVPAAAPVPAARAPAGGWHEQMVGGLRLCLPGRAA